MSLAVVGCAELVTPLGLAGTHKWSRPVTPPARINGDALLQVARQVIPKKLWIEQLVHAEMVTLNSVIHAEMVTPMRRNGDAPNKEPVATCNKCSCSRSCALWGQPCGLPPIGLAPTTNSH